MHSHFERHLGIFDVMKASKLGAIVQPELHCGDWGVFWPHEILAALVKISVSGKCSIEFLNRRGRSCSWVLLPTRVLLTTWKSSKKYFLYRRKCFHSSQLWVGHLYACYHVKVCTISIPIFSALNFCSAFYLIFYSLWHEVVILLTNNAWWCVTWHGLK